MISVHAPLVGIPPRGVCVYDPTRRRVGQGWSHLAVNPERATATDILFVGPTASTPDEYNDRQPASVDGDPLGAIARLASGIGPLTPAVIFDPENGWPQIPESERGARFAEMARALAPLAARAPLGITSHGGFPVGLIPRWLRKIAWGSPQLYYDGAGVNARVWQRWRAVFGRRLVPSIAGPRGIANPPASWSSDAGYAAYLDTIPRDVPGVLVWDLTTIRPSALQAIRDRWGGLASVPFAGLAAVDSLPGMVALAVLAIWFLLAFVKGAR